MNIHFQDSIPSNFSDQSRVWIYQASRLFTISEALDIEEILENFSKEWNSHGADVTAFANLFFGQFIIMIADESKVQVSGCSTDSSVRIIKNIEKDFNVQLLDRQLLAFILKERIQVLPMAQLNYSFENNFITPDTLYFNNTVLTKKDLLTKWIIPVKDSWLAARIPADKMV
jgi:hypothetical protein